MPANERTSDYECDQESICHDYRFLPLANVAEQGMPMLRADRVWTICGSDRYSNPWPACCKNVFRSYSELNTPACRPNQLIFSPMPGSRPLHRQPRPKAECEGISESVNPLPSFQQLFSI